MLLKTAFTRESRYCVVIVSAYFCWVLSLSSNALMSLSPNINVLMINRNIEATSKTQLLGSISISHFMPLNIKVFG